jgi:hypothetical protein
MMVTTERMMVTFRTVFLNVPSSWCCTKVISDEAGDE